MSDDTGAGDKAAHEECLVDTTDDGDEVWSPFEAEYDGVEMPPTPKVEGADGLPTVHAPVKKSDIPELSPDTLCCMGRYDEFVLRDRWGEIIARFERRDVERTPGGIYRVSSAQLAKAIAEGLHGKETRTLSSWTRAITSARETVKALLRLEASDVAKATPWYGYHVEVQPIRPPCIHYVRQMTHFDYNPEAQAIYRLCALRRTTEGAMMSLTDRAMWACDHRDPRDIDSEWRLDEFDRKKVRQGAKRVYTSIFSTGDDPDAGVFGPGPGDGDAT